MISISLNNPWLRCVIGESSRRMIYLQHSFTSQVPTNDNSHTQTADSIQANAVLNAQEPGPPVRERKKKSISFCVSFTRYYVKRIGISKALGVSTNFLFISALTLASSQR